MVAEGGVDDDDDYNDGGVGEDADRDRAGDGDGAGQHRHEHKHKRASLSHGSMGSMGLSALRLKEDGMWSSQARDEFFRGLLGREHDHDHMAGRGHLVRGGDSDNDDDDDDDGDDGVEGTGVGEARRGFRLFA